MLAQGSSFSCWGGVPPPLLVYPIRSAAGPKGGVWSPAANRESTAGAAGAARSRLAAEAAAAGLGRAGERGWSGTGRGSCRSPAGAACSVGPEASGSRGEGCAATVGTRVGGRAYPCQAAPGPSARGRAARNF